MNPEGYARDLLTDAHEEIRRGVGDLELLMGLADALCWMRDRMARGDRFFVRIEMGGALYYKAAYFRSCDGDEPAHEVEAPFLVEFDPLAGDPLGAYTPIS